MSVRQSILWGSLPMGSIALSLAVTLGVLHVRAADAEAHAKARVQAAALAVTYTGLRNEDAIASALSHALAQSAPTARAILHRRNASDIAVDSGRPLRFQHTLHTWTHTPQGELETVVDASALHDRHVAALTMTLLLCLGIAAAFLLGRRHLESTLVEPIENVRNRIDRFLHPRGAVAEGDHDALHAIDGLLDELVELRRRHDAAMAESLRRRLQEIARQTRFVEQIGDHFRQPLQALALFVAGMQPGEDLRQRAVVGQMRTSITRLNELLDGVLELARFDAGAVEPAALTVVASDVFMRSRAAVDSVIGAPPPEKDGMSGIIEHPASSHITPVNVKKSRPIRSSPSLRLRAFASGPAPPAPGHLQR